MGKVADLYGELTLKGAGEVQNALRSVGDRFKSFAGNFTQGIGGVALGLNQMLQLATRAAQVMDQAIDFTVEGAQMASMEQASHRLANTFGGSMTRIVSAIKEASYDTVSEMEIMEAANLSLTMGVSSNATEIANLLQIAAQRGRAFNLSTEDAFERITRGIGRGSIKILDDLGFNMKGVTGQADMLAAVLAQGNKELDAQGGYLFDVSTGYQRAGAAWSDFMKNVQQGAGYFFQPLVASPEEIRLTQEQKAETAILTGNYYAYSQAMKLAQAVQSSGYDRMMGLTKATEKLTQAEFDQQHVMSMTNAIWQERQGAFGQANKEYEITSYTNDLIISQEQLKVAFMTDLIDSREQLNEILAETRDLTNELTDAEREEIETTALKDFSENIEGITLQLAQMSGMSNEVIMGLGFAFGEVDEQALSAYMTMQAIADSDLSTSQKIDLVLEISGALGEDVAAGDIPGMVSDMLEGMGGQAAFELKAELTGTDGIKSTLEEITGGIYQPDLTIISNADEVRSELHELNNTPLYSKTATLTYRVVTIGGGGFGKPPMMMHGGAVIGGQHGMVIPPGFSNDGMPVMVSSGERLDVTPAGNSSKGDGQNTFKFYGPVSFKVSEDMRTIDLMEQLR